MIKHADSDAERADVLALFHRVFDDIAPAAVPMTDADAMYAPLVVQYRSSDSGRLLGAALSCRTQLAAGTSMLRPMPSSKVLLPDDRDYRTVLDKHSELDLMADEPEMRGQGIGGAMLNHMETVLRERGARVWFGNVTTDLDTVALRQFYTSHGFNVLEDGHPLPNLPGKNWLPFGMDPGVAFYFYKAIKRTQISVSS
ncbi:GNAT family N-acetyltransferase [Amycolatopsis sp. lyj-84]|uniref:GNAT family N-acetyltransferase n=1 Tax=Amycolatopsis sp. lyj-84 TaxID=2789284 RepID=UPI00397E1ED3